MQNVSVDINLKAGATVKIQLPEPGEGPSFFLTSLPKAGSTLFYSMMRPIAKKLNYSYFSLPNTLRELGLPAHQLDADIANIFLPEGYAYGGFRGIDAPIKLPAFASGRTAFLIRDPRDMATSLYFSEAFSHREPGAVASDELLNQFQARREKALSSSIEEFVLVRSTGVLKTYSETLASLEGLDYRLYRYEDVISDKFNWMKDLLAYLNLEAPEAFLRSIVARNDVKPATENVNEHVRRVTPGDHKEKLSPATIEKLDALFAPILKRFNYA